MIKGSRTPTEGLERRRRHSGKEEKVGDDGAVTGGDGKCPKVGVGGRDGGDGSAWVGLVNPRKKKTTEECKTYLIAVGKCESEG